MEPHPVTTPWLAGPRGPTASRRLVVAVLALGLGAAACGGSTRYFWGRYEASVLRLELAPDDPGSVQTSIEELNEDIEKARSRGQPLPPGFHAHLGYLYARAGDLAEATRHLRLEKELYPESATFVDGLLAGLRR